MRLRRSCATATTVSSSCALQSAQAEASHPKYVLQVSDSNCSKAAVPTAAVEWWVRQGWNL
jgi:hypothetical protein